MPDYGSVYEQITASSPDVDFIGLDQTELRGLRRVLRAMNFSPYDNVLLDIPFKHLHSETSRLLAMPGPVIYEQDACQNFIPGSKWFGMFETFYRALPHACFALTGYSVTQQFRQLGLNAHFVPKGFDEKGLYPLESTRDIAAGFIGRVRSQVYSARQELLESLSASHGVSLLRTQTVDDYRQTLNRIGVFVSADIGLGEYMAKNFEAMACGCALLAYRQGDGEEEALGLRDMENVVLYRSVEEASDKLSLLLSDEALRTRIADSGRKLAWQRFRYSKLAENLYQLAVDTPSETARSPSLWEKLALVVRRTTTEKPSDT